MAKLTDLSQINEKLQECVGMIKVIGSLQNERVHDEGRREVSIEACETEGCEIAQQGIYDDHDMELRKEIQRQRHHLMKQLHDMSELASRIAA